MDKRASALLVLCLAWPGASYAEGGKVRPAPLVSDRLLAALIEANGVPGMGAAVVRDGETVWTGTAGHRDVERGLPVEHDTVFRLASVSKVVAATAAAKLGEQGALDVDAPVQTVLPWLDAPWPPITPRQLASHTSGMPHYQPVDSDRGGTHYASVRDAVGIFRQRPLLFTPGTGYSYSSWGYTLLSAAVESGAGGSFLDYVQRVVAPGLAIGPDATNSNDPRASRAYTFVDGSAVPAARHDFSYTWAGGGLGATPSAIAQFGGRVMAGSIVSPATFNAMLAPTRLADGRPATERDYEVGFGWRVGKDTDGARIAHHAGVTEGARSALVLWPERRLAVSVLSNALWVSSIEQTAILLAAPFQREAERPTLPARACPVQATRYSAVFDGQAFNGTARFTVDAGTCVGSMSLPPGALRDWLNGFPQRDVESLALVGLDTQAGLSRAALVTPIGLHDLRAQADATDSYRVGFGSGRSLSVRFLPRADAGAVATGYRRPHSSGRPVMPKSITTPVESRWQ